MDKFQLPQIRGTDSERIIQLFSCLYKLVEKLNNSVLPNMTANKVLDNMLSELNENNANSEEIANKLSEVTKKINEINGV